MATLTVNDFSCIKNAEFTPSSITLIIGPQGSGKSVTTKLFYFCTELLSSFVKAAERGLTFDDFKRFIAKEFNNWFPPTAWGPKRFNIQYHSGPFQVRILRRMSKGMPSEHVSVTFSSWFQEMYTDAARMFEQSGIPEEHLDDIGRDLSDIDRSWDIREKINHRLSVSMGGDYISQQTFIPAGRAFFTSIGRLVAGIEQAGNLDPVTIRFARLFANVRDMNSRRISLRRRRLADEYIEKRKQQMLTFFGGDIRFETDFEYVEAEDGRKIPFSSLSSGQQEIMPMWSIIDYFNERHALSNIRSPRRRLHALMYIEEPEAHLFPSAQSDLMEFLVGSPAIREGRNLILTTHSPYIMSKINVLVKAGWLSRRKKRNQDINEIVPRESWLQPDNVSAYALDGGCLKDLIEDDGLVNGDYLDEISEEIAKQYGQLLQIEAET